MAEDTPVNAGQGVPRRRVLVYALLFLMSAINYGDRAALSIGAPAIAKEFGLSPVQIGYVLSSFLWTYFLFNLPAGLIADRFGARRSAAFAVALWSAATALTGATFSLWFLIATRMVMGVGEAFGFPVGNRAVREWAPVRAVLSPVKTFHSTVPIAASSAYQYASPPPTYTTPLP